MGFMELSVDITPIFSGFYWKFPFRKTVVNSNINNDFLDELFVKFGRLANKWNKMLPEAFNRFYNALWYYSAKLLIILVRLISESSDRNGHTARSLVHDLSSSYF